MPQFDPYYKWLGIPGDEQPPSHYRLLGLREFESDPEVIAAAAERQITFLRGCATGEHAAEAHRLLNEVVAARACLSNPHTRAAYDDTLRGGTTGPKPPRPRPVPMPTAVRKARVVPAAAAAGQDHQRRNVERNPLVATVVAVALGAAAAFGAFHLLRGRDTGSNESTARALAADRQPGDGQQRHQRPLAEGAIAEDENLRDVRPAAEADPLQVGEAIDLPAEPREVEAAGGGNADLPADVPPAEPPRDPNEAPIAAAEPGGERGPPDALEADAANARQPVPARDEQQRMRVEIREIFADEFSELRTAAERTALAERLLKQAEETRGNPAAQYVLFDEARELGLAAADPAVVQKAIDATAGAFELEPFSAKLEAFKSIARSARTASEREALVETALAVAEAASEAKEFDVALELASLAWTVSARLRDADLRAEAAERRDAIRERRQRWVDAEIARATLADSPDDPQASETLGRYLCFVEGEWSEGLPHLARAANPALRSAAEQELEAGEDPPPEVRTRIGDAWFELAKASSRSERPDYRVRAGDWYRRALENLTGLERTRVEKHIEELDRQALRETGAADKRVGGAKAAEGMIGRCLVDNVDAAVILRYEPGRFIHNNDLRDLLGRHGIAGASLRIELHGVLAVPRDMALKVTHIGGTSAGGVLRLYVNERELGAVGDNRTKSTVYTLALPKGLYAVRWQLTGGDIGPAHIEFADAASDEAVPVFHTQPMLRRLRRLPTSQELDASAE